MNRDQKKQPMPFSCPFQFKPMGCVPDTLALVLFKMERASWHSMTEQRCQNQDTPLKSNKINRPRTQPNDPIIAKKKKHQE